MNRIKNSTLKPILAITIIHGVIALTLLTINYFDIFYADTNPVFTESIISKIFFIIFICSVIYPFISILLTLILLAFSIINIVKQIRRKVFINIIILTICSQAMLAYVTFDLYFDPNVF